MNRDQFFEELEAFVPGCQIEFDNDGQIVIYTNKMLSLDDGGETVVEYEPS